MMVSNNNNKRFTAGLSLNGGGMHYHFTIVMLLLLEKKLKEPLYKYFDIIAGTSAGAILLGFTMPHSDDPSKPMLTMEDYIHFNLSCYGNENKSEADRIFTPLPLKTINMIQGGPIYDGDVLEDIMKHHMGNRTVNDALTNVLIPLINSSNEAIFIKNRALIEKTHGHTFYNFYLHDIIRAATAARYFFKPKKLCSLPDINGNTYSDIMFDAGLNYNNPSSVMLSDMDVFKKDNETPMVINIGFSKVRRYKPSGHLVRELVAINEMAMDCSTNAVKQELRRRESRGEIEYYDLTDIFDPEAYAKNIDPEEGHQEYGFYGHLGNTDRAHLDFLKERAYQTFQSKLDLIDKLVNRLETERLLREQENDARIITEKEKIESFSSGQAHQNRFSQPKL